MPVRPEPWPTGAPAWIDLMVPDVDRATEFYGALFGWTFEALGDSTDVIYLDARRDGSSAAGIGEVPPGVDVPPAAWTTYLATADVEATAAAAVAEGATLLLGPESAGDAGGFAVLSDPTGSVVGLWQSGMHSGVELTDEPGSMTWAESMTDDVDRAMTFYGDVFGYTYTDMSAPGFTYASFAVDGQTAGGIGSLDDEGRAVGPHWRIYFKVADVDEAVGRLTQYGGEVVKGAWDSPFGRIALVTGPFGEGFALMSDLAEEPALEQEATGGG